MFAVVPINDEARDPPHSLRVAFRSEPSVAGGAVDPRKLLLGTILAPSYGFPLRVDEYPVRPSVLNECSLLSAVHLGFLNPGDRSLADCLGKISMVVQTPTDVRAPGPDVSRKASRSLPRSPLPIPSSSTPELLATSCRAMVERLT